MNAPFRTPPVPAAKLPLVVLIAAPRGFCAGVDRAIEIVERALERYGAPVYVRHEIVHNKHVVERLKAMGAIFVKELDECPDDRPVVFSAHGVPKSVPATARSREMLFLDATCPLVSKVHVEAERHHANGRHIILIGHAGHPEVVGTLGSAGFTTVAMTLADDAVDLGALAGPDGPERVAVLVGTEGAGLSARWSHQAAVRARIPMQAGIDSLNVAAATAIACYVLGSSGTVSGSRLSRGDTGQSSG